MALFDVCLAFGLFAFVSAVFHHQSPLVSGLALTVFCVLLPDWDFLPFMLFEKRFPWLYSHSQISHYPGIYALALAVIWGFTPINGYYLSLVAWALAAHFLDDLFGDIPGGDWGVAIFPKTKRYSIENGHFMIRAADQVPAWFIKRKSNTQKKSFKEMIWNRLFRMDAVKTIFSFLSLSLFLFWLCIPE